MDQSYLLVLLLIVPRSSSADLAIMADSVTKEEVTHAETNVASKEKTPDRFVGQVTGQHPRASTYMSSSGSSYQDQDYAEQGHVEKVNLNNNVSAKYVMLLVFRGNRCTDYSLLL